MVMTFPSREIVRVPVMTTFPAFFRANSVLKAPVVATDEQGNRRVSGGKKATRGTPQGGARLRRRLRRAAFA
jgi:hypothetical protein